MEIDAILDGIRSITENQIAEIKQQTDQKVQEILSQAKKETDAIRKNLEKEGHVRLNREVAIIQQQAEMQYLQNVSDGRQKLIQESLEQVESVLKTIRIQKNYGDLLIHLAKEAIEDLLPSLGTAQEIVLYADPRDRELLQGLKVDGQTKLRIEYDLDCWGGCNVSSLDGKVVVYNTLNDRFQKATPILQQWLSLYFSEKTTRVK